MNYPKKQTWILIVALVGCCWAAYGCGQSGSVQAGGKRYTSDDFRTWYTIRLSVIRNQGHAATAAEYLRRVEKLTGWKDLFIATQDNQSLVCWGKYDSVESFRAQRRLKKAKAWTAPSNGAKLFQFALIMPLRGANPGPPQWDLANASGVNTVQVAEFFDVPKSRYIGRKKFALEYCKELRKNNYDAYFHHGLFKSIVTIGAFPAESVRRYQTGRIARLEIRDSRIQKIVQAFPQLAINGAGEKIGGVDVPSKVILIPRNKVDNNALPLDSRSNR